MVLRDINITPTAGIKRIPKLYKTPAAMGIANVCDRDYHLCKDQPDDLTRWYWCDGDQWTFIRDCNQTYTKA